MDYCIPVFLSYELDVELEDEVELDELESDTVEFEFDDTRLHEQSVCVSQKVSAYID